MWNKYPVVTIEFGITEMYYFLRKKGYEIRKVKVNEYDDEEQREIEIIYDVPYPSEIYDNIESSVYRNMNIHHPQDPVRIIFEQEIKKKLLN